MIESAGHTVLLDPFLTGSPTAAATPEKVSPNFILISHGHADHVGDTISIARRTGATVIAIVEVGQWLALQGVPQQQIHTMNLGGGYDFPFGCVQMTLATHTSTMPDGSCGGNPAGFIVSLPEGNVYFACDTGLFGDMQIIGRRGIELAVLPIGDNFTMGPDDALEAVRLITPRRVAPMHYGTWPLIAQDAEAWATRVKEATETTPIVLEPGGVVEL
jgi:L-ascorbate metabolism protein UlaG (beta-lactamase superfamily)